MSRVSATMLRDRGRTVAAAIGCTGGGNEINLAFVMAEAEYGRRLDPAFAANAAPVIAWCEAVWMKWIPLNLMKKMMARAVVNLAAASRLWAKVCGLAAAAAATVGWEVKDAFTIMTDTGDTIDIQADPPAEVRKMLDAAAERWRWRQAERQACGADPHGDGRGVMTAAFKRLLSVKSLNSSWTKGHQAALKSAVAGGQWPQARLFTAGLASNALCQRCLGERDVNNLTAEEVVEQVPVGTVWHRLCTCGPNRRQRARLEPHEAEADERLRVKAAADRDADERGQPGHSGRATATWRRALCPPPDHAFCMPPREDEGTYHGVVQPMDGVARGPSLQSARTVRRWLPHTVLPPVG